jgi:hypothetical protein
LQTVAVEPTRLDLEPDLGQLGLDMLVGSPVVQHPMEHQSHTQPVVVPAPEAMGKILSTHSSLEMVDQELQLESAATPSTLLAVAAVVLTVGGITPLDKISHQVPLETVVSVVAVPAQHCSTTGLGLELVLVNQIPVAAVVVQVPTETQTLLVEPVDLVL